MKTSIVLRSALSLGAMVLLAGCNSSGSGSDSNDNENGAQENAAPQEFYAAKGPYKAGSVIQFFELNAGSGLRQGTEVADATVGELGAYSLPALSGWIEAEVSGDFFAEYDGSFTEDGGLTTTAIFDLAGSREGRNINLFTHLAAARAHQLLAEGTADSLEAAYSGALDDLLADFNLNHPPEDLHPFYGADRSRSRLDDYAALLIASTVVSNEIETPEEFDAFVSAYATDRTESRNEHMETLVEEIRDSGGVFLARALGNLNELQQDNGIDVSDRLSLGWILSGCAAAQAFNVDTVICLDDLRSTYQFSLPAGDGNYVRELYYYPSQAGTWALEVAHDERCLSRWTTQTLGGFALVDSGSGWFNSRVNQRLLTTQRLDTRMYRLRVTLDRDDCSASETELNFRRVAEGRESVNDRGNVYLENGVTYRGIVSAYQSTSGSNERSSNRSYYYFVTPSTAGTYRIELDYSDSSSSDMGTHLRYLSESGLSAGDFIPESSDIIDEVFSTSQTREFESTAGRVYRIEVRNDSPSTININASNSYRRLPFDLTITRQ